MALDGCGKIGGAPADQTESEDLVDHFARLAASSQPAGKSRRKPQQEAKGLPDSENLKEMAKALRLGTDASIAVRRSGGAFMTLFLIFFLVCRAFV